MKYKKVSQSRWHTPQDNLSDDRTTPLQGYLRDRSETLRGLEDEDNPMDRINDIHSLLKKFLDSHLGFLRMMNVLTRQECRMISQSLDMSLSTSCLQLLPAVLFAKQFGWTCSRMCHTKNCLRISTVHGEPLMRRHQHAPMMDVGFIPLNSSLRNFKSSVFPYLFQSRS